MVGVNGEQKFKDWMRDKLVSLEIPDACPPVRGKVDAVSERDFFAIQTIVARRGISHGRQHEGIH